MQSSYVFGFPPGAPVQGWKVACKGVLKSAESTKRTSGNRGPRLQSRLFYPRVKVTSNSLLNLGDCSQSPVTGKEIKHWNSIFLRNSCAGTFNRQKESPSRTNDRSAIWTHPMMTPTTPLGPWPLMEHHPSQRGFLSGWNRLLLDPWIEESPFIHPHPWVAHMQVFLRVSLPVQGWLAVQIQGWLPWVPDALILCHGYNNEIVEGEIKLLILVSIKRGMS